MINHLLLICLVVFIYELFKYTNLLSHIHSQFRIFKKFLVLIKVKKASDSNKEKLTLNYSKTLLILSIKIILNILFVFVLILILNKFSSSYIDFILSTFALVEITIVFLIYRKFRKKIYEKL